MHSQSCTINLRTFSSPQKETLCPEAVTPHPHRLISHHSFPARHLQPGLHSLPLMLTPFSLPVLLPGVFLLQLFTWLLALSRSSFSAQIVPLPGDRSRYPKVAPPLPSSLYYITLLISCVTPSEIGVRSECAGTRTLSTVFPLVAPAHGTVPAATWKVLIWHLLNE